MSTTATPISYRLVILIKPFINSDKLTIKECTLVSQDRAHLMVTTDGRNRFCVGRDVIVDMEVSVAR